MVEMKVRLCKKLEESELAGEKVMIDFDSGKYFLVKGVGNDIWDMLVINQSLKVEDVITKLIGEYDVSEEECKESVLQFFDQLCKAGLLKYEKNE